MTLFFPSTHQTPSARAACHIRPEMVMVWELRGEDIAEHYLLAPAQDDPYKTDWIYLGADTPPEPTSL